LKLNELTENQHEQEEVDEEVDVELQNTMKNLKIDESAFALTATTDKTKQKVVEKTQNQKNKKTKKSKGVDFMEYANKNGIQVNLQYEEKEEKINMKKRSSKANNNTNKRK